MKLIIRSSQKRLFSYILVLFAGILFFSSCFLFPLEQFDNTMKPGIGTVTPELNYQHPGTDQFSDPQQTLSCAQKTSTSTAFPTNQFTLVDSFSDHFLIIKDIASDHFLHSLGTGFVEELGDPDLIVDFLEWQDTGCFFVARDYAGNIDRYNLQGQIIEELLAINDLYERNIRPFRFRAHISPDHQWIWFWEASGGFIGEASDQPRAEFQDILIISLDLRAGPFHTSSNGGAWVASWDPSGENLAFSDYDDQGVHQVYVFSIFSREAIQLSEFNIPSTWDQYRGGVDEIIWSPNGNAISVNYYENEVIQSSIYKIENEVFFFAVNIPDSRVLWWVDEQMVVVWKESGEATGIYTFDLAEKNFEEHILARDFPYIQQIHPFQEADTAGFYSTAGLTQFFLYNFKDNSVGIIPNISLIPEQTDWIITPADFPGMNYCLQ